MLAASCLALWLLPAGCFTAGLWSGDHRSHEYDDIDGVRAFLWPGDATAFAVSLDDAAVAKLRAAAPEGPVAGWLRVSVPPADADQVLARYWVDLWLVHESGAAPTWWIGVRGGPQKLAPPRKPTRQACKVTALPGEPEWLGAAMENVRVADVVVLDDSMSFLVRAAVTPVAVAVDAIYGAFAIAVSPFALLAWVEHTCSNYGL